MGLNIEIKARCADIKAVEDIVQKMNFPFEGLEQQTDTFFSVPNGRLKIRESSTKGTYVIPYIRPDVSKPRVSDYALIKLDDPDQVIDLFEQMFGIRKVVEKTRKVYMYDNIRVHLDNVENLGEFIELEGVITKTDQRAETLQKIELLMELFNISDNDIIINAYVDLLEKKEGK